MKKHTTSTAIPTYALKAEALASMSDERFCLAAGLETLSEMLEQDATAACGERHERGERRHASRFRARCARRAERSRAVCSSRGRVSGTPAEVLIELLATLSGDDTLFHCARATVARFA